MELTRHFFRRFFENDVLQLEGDSMTTLARGLAIVAVPELMVAFFLVNQYPQRTAWGRLQDVYFFVLFSAVVMAGVALFEWEALFPERLDFLVLTPLPLRTGQLLLAKGAALGSFLGFFLVAANGLGVLMLPIISRPESIWRMALAQATAVAMAGSFAAWTVVGTGGVLICILPPGVFRRISPLLQMLAVVGLGLLVVQYLRLGDQMDVFLTQPRGAVRWVPTFWFLGVYDRVLHGASAQPFAGPLARMGMLGWISSAGLAVFVYPLAWARVRRMSVEGAASRGKPPVTMSWSNVGGRLLRTPIERGVFDFIGQTMARESRYQVYLAIYAGTGLALAISCATTFTASEGQMRLQMYDFGLHAVLPLLLFWTIAGLRMAFALPLNLPARWIFRCTGADLRVCARATREWAFGCGLGVAGAVCLSLYAAGWGARRLLVQAVCGVCLCAMLVDGFFWGQKGAPFTRPRTPGKTSLPAMLTLYLGVLPLFLYGMAYAEASIERSLWKAALPMAATVGAHAIAGWMRERFLYVAEDGNESGEGEYQLLGLSGDHGV